MFFQWTANPVNDMLADAVMVVILKANEENQVQKGKHFSSKFKSFLIKQLLK
jgi:hypothetical protein